MSRKKIQGITIKLDGDSTPLQKALKDVDKSSSKTTKELGQINRALKFDEGNTTLLSQKFEVLQDAVQHTSKRLDSLKQAQSEVEKQFKSGEIDASSYREFIREIERTESKLNGFKSELSGLDAKVNVQADTSALDKVSTKLKSLGGEAKQAGKEIASGIAAGAAGATAALGGIAIAGNETAGDLAKMNATLSNLGFDNTTGAFDEILTKSAAVTGEMDSAVEAINNLANTDMNQSQLAQTMEHLTGASIQFSDTLKLEGLADGLQETLALGEATGMFGEYLERSSMDLETFNAGLATAQANGTEMDYVLQTLSDAGAKSFLDTYKDMNGALYDNQQAQAELEIQTGKLSETLAPITSTVTSIVAGLLEWMNNNPVLANTLLVVLGAITALAGIIALLAPLISGLTVIAGAFGVGIGALLSPIAAVVGAVLGVIALVALLKAAWNPLTKFFSTLWDGIVSAFKGAWDIIKAIFEGAVNMFKMPINAIIQLINKFIGGLNKIQIPEWIPKIGGKGLSIPEIPMLAKGTDYFKRTGVALVGEAGPELVTLPQGAKVHPNGKTQQMLGGDININVSQLVVREEADLKRIAKELYWMHEKEQRGR